MIQLLIVMTLVSFSTRIFPFLFSKQARKFKFMHQLSRTLPPCIGIFLVAHCLEDVTFQSFPFAIPELSALGGVVLTQVFFRNILGSMAAGVLIHQVILKVFN